MSLFFSRHLPQSLLFAQYKLFADSAGAKYSLLTKWLLLWISIFDRKWENGACRPLRCLRSESRADGQRNDSRRIYDGTRRQILCRDNAVTGVSAARVFITWFGPEVAAIGHRNCAAAAEPLFSGTARWLWRHVWRVIIDAHVRCGAGSLTTSVNSAVLPAGHVTTTHSDPGHCCNPSQSIACFCTRGVSRCSSVCLSSYAAEVCVSCQLRSAAIPQ